MNTTPIKKRRSGKIRHLPGMTAAGFPSLPFAGQSPAQAAAKNVCAGSTGTVTRKKGFRCGVLVLLFTCGLLFAMGGTGLAQDVDGDGVADINDLDDDNDGITDCVENGLDTEDITDVFAFSGTAFHNPNISKRAILTMTSDNQAGAAMSKRKIDFREPFTIAFEAYVGRKDSDGGEGMAAVFHNDPDGSGALGTGGALLGAGGIQNGIALEFDTHESSNNDSPEDHTSIWDTDRIVGGEPGSYLTTAIGHGNLEFQQWHDVEISWNPGTKTLSYTLNGKDAGSYTHRGTTDFVTEYFGGANLVHFGVTAATGGLNNVHEIDFDGFCSLPLRLDTDGDGVPNHRDLDSDADGISDLAESGANDAALDTDNDGMIDASFPDTDGDGLADDIETANGGDTGTTPRDTDSDGAPDYHDLDSDADGCPDAVEGDPTPSPLLDCGDIGSDGRLDQGVYPADERGRHLGTQLIQGVGSAADSSVSPCSGADDCNIGRDTDGDGVADINDLDDDNDGITDCVENGLDTEDITDVFDLKGTAYHNPNSSNTAILTVYSNDQAGAIMSRNKIDFREPFTIAFEAYLGTRDWNGADGMAAVFHNDSRGTRAIGRRGGSLGAGGIQNGIALELDTYVALNENGASYQDHTSIWDTDQMRGRHPSSYLTRAIGHGNLEDGQWHDVEISWIPGTQTLSYTLDGAYAGSYAHPGTTDFVTEYFGGAHQVHFGVTAATGGYTNTQSIRFGDFCSLSLGLDTDGDGVPNHLDLDSDADGISDLAESGADDAALDTDNDGMIDDSFPDGDGDGLADVIETANGGDTGTTPRDTDSDGAPDYHDRDSDADVCPDAVEGDRSPSLDCDDLGSDGRLDQGAYPADERGRHLGTERIQGVGSAADRSVNPCNDIDNCGSWRDTDGDGVADINDLDDDNDGITDCVENGLDTEDITDVFAFSGTAYRTSSDRKRVVLTVTLDNQAGAAMSKRKIDFRESFTIAFRAYVGRKDRDGGEGMAAVFHNDPDGSGALGTGGALLGAGGIQNGIALEFDTHESSNNDSPEDHTSIWDTDRIVGGEPGSYLTTAIGHGNLEFQQWHDVEISWNPGTKTLSYTLNGKDAGSYTHRGTTDFVTEYFGGANLVHFGVTAATGGLNNVHEIDFDGFCSLPFRLDTDGDGVPNHLDLDSDADGISDLAESGADDAALDTDNDGMIDASFPDTDGDGLADDIETANGGDTGTTPRDTDSDGTPDYHDRDSDADGCSDAAEGDRIPSLDCGDIGSDGRLDQGVYPADERGRHLGTQLIQGVGSAADRSVSPCIGSDNCSIRDTDGDGVPDINDLDDDNDGITDCVENGLDTADVTDVFAFLGTAYENPLDVAGDILTVFSANETGAMMSRRKIDFRQPFTIAFLANVGTRDRDGGEGMAAVFHNDPRGSAALGTGGALLGAGGIQNGIALEFDTYENSNNDSPEDHTSIWDTDGIVGGEPGSYLTTAIGHGDIEEDIRYHDVEISWNPGSQTLSYTLDGDNAGSYTHSGTTDFVTEYFGGANLVHFGLTAATGDSTLPNAHLVFFYGFCSLPFWLDTDGDGVPNHLDLDSDADGISDLAESGADDAALDTDNDGKIDDSFPDTDGDGLADVIETANGGDTGTTPKDTDSDGAPDYHDLDSDADGCPDAVEGDRSPSLDCDDLGSGGRLDQGAYPADERGRHLGTERIQGVGSAADSGVNACNDIDNCGSWRDTDGDGVADINDLDDDNDGITDCVENGLDTADVTDVFALSGSAVPVADNEVSLTRSSPDQAGAAMSKGKVDFREPFTIAFEAYVGRKDSDGGNGMAAVFHNDPDGSGALGTGGALLGAGGIQNGIALEFDTHESSNNDSPEDHTSIWDTDRIVGGEPGSYLTTAIGHGNLEFLQWHDVEISWNPGTKTLSYTLNGKDAGSYTHSGTTDFVTEYFGGANLVHFGITAATGTGDLVNPHVIQFDDVFCSLPFRFDTDGDGVPNHRDLDSDADGISDLAESGADDATLDVNNDGKIDASFPVGRNGLADVIEAANGRGNGTTPRDTDSDGAPDYHDRDSDADSCPDAVEGDRSPSLDCDDLGSDGRLDQGAYPADDLGRHLGTERIQGVGSAADSSVNACNNIDNCRDADGDGVSDINDLDNDNDGITDCVENGLDTADVTDVFALSGRAYRTYSDHKRVVLTVYQPDQAGAAMSKGKIDFRESFTIAFRTHLGVKDSNGGEGMAAVFHNDPRGSGALGTGGALLGAGGIQNGIALEFDTHESSNNDSPEDHTSIWDTDDGIDRGEPGSYLTTAIAHGNLEDRLRLWHDVEISWVPGTQTLSYTLDGKDAGSYTHRGTTDFVTEYFGGANLVHFGFTAATTATGTGDLVNSHVIQFDDGFCSLPFRFDTDGDGVPNHLDLDSDGDGISDLAESGANDATLDVNNDGEIDASFPVGDNGLADVIEAANGEDTGTTPRGTDSDGTPDYHDRDSDADGCLDAVEGDRSPSLDCGDIGSDGRLDQGAYPADERGRHLGTERIQGVGSAADSSVNPCGGIDGCNIARDTDGDGVSDINDLDDDNDGITDCVENGADTAGLTDVFDLRGSAVQIDRIFGNHVRLTPDSPDQAGAVWFTDKVDFREPFTIAFRAYLGDRDEYGGVGMAAVFHNDPRGSGVPGLAGRGGEFLGAGGIQNGIALEFDTYDNSNDDLPEDHTSIWDTDYRVVDTGMIWHYLTTPIGYGNLEDGQWRDVEISWVPGTKTLSYTLDEKDAGSVSPFDYLSYFGGANLVHFGITAATRESLRTGWPEVSNDHSIDFDDSCSLPFRLDTDGDGVPNHLDLDSDGDGISDLAESGANDATLDVNNDGEIDASFPDADGDGLADVIETTNGGDTGTTPRDTDSDGAPDYHDRDSDADGCSDAVEGDRIPSLDCDDLGSDGRLDQGAYPADDRGRHLGTERIQGVGSAADSSVSPCSGSDNCSIRDADGDGIVNTSDIDDDNDGITDCVENGLDTRSVTDVFAFGGEAFQHSAYNRAVLTMDLNDQEGAIMSKGKVDFREPFTIAFKAYLGTDSKTGPSTPSKPSKPSGDDRRGMVAMAAVFHNDPDGSAAIGTGGALLGAGGIRNGIALEIESSPGSGAKRKWTAHTSIWDTDRIVGGEPGSYLTTAIGHGNLGDRRWHEAEISWVPGNQTLSYTLDGANAGSYTYSGTTDFVTEYFGGAHQVHFGVTAATGGYANIQSILFGVRGFCSLPLRLDTDGDGVPNHLDLDSDADGISDLAESGADHATLDTDNDGMIDASFPDTDGDGLADVIENRNGEDTGTTPKDTDSDGTPDYHDRDSDADGCPDAVEGDRSPSLDCGDIGSDGRLDQGAYPADERGRHLGTERIQGVGSAADSSVNPCSGSDNCSTRRTRRHTEGDTDGDTVADINDLDDDNDGITDSVENKVQGALQDIFVLSGDAEQASGDRYQAQLTPDSRDQEGAIMSKGKIDFREPFTIRFAAHFGTRRWDGGNGMAAVFHNDPKGSAAVGTLKADFGAGGIQNGIALEFDTSNGSAENWGTEYRRWDDHTSIWDTDQMGGYLGREPVSYLTTAIAHGNLEDRQWHDVEISWDPGTQTLSYTLDGDNAGSYTHRGTTGFVTEYFGGANLVHFGISANTGDHTNVQRIRFVESDFRSLPLIFDTDGDGVPNHLDLDSDGDGNWDLEESGADHILLDGNNDGEIDAAFPDTDGDGLADDIETANGEDTGTTPRDSNNDGLPDFRDSRS